MTPQRVLIKLQFTHQFEVGLGSGRGLLCILLCQWLLAIHLEKGNQWWVWFSEWSTQSFLQLVATTLCAIGIDDFMDIGNNILHRKRRKKEGMLIRTFWHLFSDQNAFLSHKQTSCCDIDAEQQENWNQSIQSSSIHPYIHPSIQTVVFVGATGSLVANYITITYGMPHDEVEQDDGKYSTILRKG